MNVSMKVPEDCARCLYDQQAARTKDEAYLARVREILENRRPEDSAPYMVYLFGREFERRFGVSRRFAGDKRRYNELVLSMEADLRRRIEAAPDPLKEALVCARLGNYIDFGAMESVDPDAFLRLFDGAGMSGADEATYALFLDRCAKGRHFLLLCDNCGEIVLDRLMLEQLHRRFPHLELTALVRGGEALNDATVEDARFAGMDRVARVIGNGEAIAGTVYGMLSDEARRAVDEADVILSKGQGNYESFAGSGREAFYAFLCKCDLFVRRYGVPRFAGMFLMES